MESPSLMKAKYYLVTTRSREQSCELGIPEKAPSSPGDARDILNNIHCKSNEPCYRIAVLRTVCDYVSGMTDDYAILCFNRLYAGTKDLRL